MPASKKIRGKRRRFAGLEQRYQQGTAALNPASLKRWHYEYEKLGLGPWHWHQRQPPKAVRQVAAQYLLDTFLAWNQQLHNQPESYYLAVWLVSPDFAHSSQVVAGVQERIRWYATGFGDAVPEGPPLPPEYQQLPGAGQLSWRTHHWEAMLDRFDYPTSWPAWVLRKPHRPYQTPDGQEYLLVQTGWVWVGTLPTPSHPA
ncbi:hypothetical protein HER32_19575 [Hymenobacter sp. BT18]|uniref:hypothetical protein n=1 Tax=Hymenobacter sp. BT18 TaxID=2835648 RepID=UPI00143EC088|nr:hypothetical protein [Hymenobacter sp. BT18]QIX63254.1 hypothetical protein HER32_19575 [Hymenobacter sp. BT18]